MENANIPNIPDAFRLFVVDREQSSAQPAVQQQATGSHRVERNRENQSAGSRASVTYRSSHRFAAPSQAAPTVNAPAIIRRRYLSIATNNHVYASESSAERATAFMFRPPPQTITHTLILPSGMHQQFPYYYLPTGGGGYFHQ